MSLSIINDWSLKCYISKDRKTVSICRQTPKIYTIHIVRRSIIYQKSNVINQLHCGNLSEIRHVRFCLYDNNIIVFCPWFGFLEFGKHMTCRGVSHSVRHSNTAVVSWIYHTVLFNLFLILIITMYLRSDIGMYHICTHTSKLFLC